MIVLPLRALELWQAGRSFAERCGIADNNINKISEDSLTIRAIVVI